jgi:hypothetical protein
MTTRRRLFIVKIFGFLLLALIVFAGFGQAVLQLWNWLMPSIFGLHTITYWQAVGLLALSWIFFRGFHGPRFSRGPWGHGMRERWGRMTPAEREEFVKGLRSRGETESPAPEPKA